MELYYQKNEWAFIQKEATLKLERTDRQVIKIIIKYKNISEEAFVRKNSNKPSHKKNPKWYIRWDYKWLFN